MADGRRNNKGGKRTGAGRPLTIRGKLKRGLFTKEQTYMLEPILFRESKPGQQQRYWNKSTRGDVVLWYLRERSNTGNKGDAKALTKLRKYREILPADKYANLLFNVYDQIAGRIDFSHILRSYVRPIQKRAPRQVVQKKSLDERVAEITSTIKTMRPVSQPPQKQMAAPLGNGQSNISEAEFNKRMRRNQ